jgi:hypothetical protein
MRRMWLYGVGAAVAGAIASGGAAAPEPVTILARGPFTLYGSVATDRPDEIVTIQARDCGSPSPTFRDVAEARTREGGSWSLEFSTGITSTLRAVWKDNVSVPITVQQRANVRLLPLASRRGFTVTVSGRTQFWKKRVLFQRFDRRLGTWHLVKVVVLTKTGGFPGYGGAAAWAEFRASLPRGTLVRAVFPRSQARPCYLGGVSKLVRT